MVNRVTLLGRVGQAPDVKRLPNGTPVANYSLATSEKWKDDNGEWKEATEWHRIVAWKQLAEVSEKYIAKGSLIFVEGKLTYRKYTDSNGIEKTTTEIVATTIKLLEKKEGSTEQQNNPPSVSAPKDDVFSTKHTALEENAAVSEKIPFAVNQIYRNREGITLKILGFDGLAKMVQFISSTNKKSEYTFEQWDKSIAPSFHLQEPVKKIETVPSVGDDNSLPF